MDVVHFLAVFLSLYVHCTHLLSHLAVTIAVQVINALAALYVLPAEGKTVKRRKRRWGRSKRFIVFIPVAKRG